VRRILIFLAPEGWQPNLQAVFAGLEGSVGFPPTKSAEFHQASVLLGMIVLLRVRHIFFSSLSDSRTNPFNPMQSDT
jgi:hypothetical protein